jgi:hypothetical protein
MTVAWLGVSGYEDIILGPKPEEMPDLHADSDEEDDDEEEEEPIPVVASVSTPSRPSPIPRIVEKESKTPSPSNAPLADFSKRKVDWDALASTDTNFIFGEDGRTIKCKCCTSARSSAIACKPAYSLSSHKVCVA